MDPETEGNFLTAKIMGIPAWVVLLGAAALGYFLLRKSASGSGGSPSTSGGGGTVTTGQTTIDSGAVQISVSQGNPQPSPTPATKTLSSTTKSIKVQNMDVQNIAYDQGMTEAQLVALNPNLKQYVGTGKTVPKGTTIKVPTNSGPTLV